MPTPPEPGEPPERPVLEPIRVLRPRRTDALAALFRELTEDRPPTGYEPVAVGAGRPGGAADTEADTQELPPCPAEIGRASGGKELMSKGVYHGVRR
ncbi:hypothetical protein ABZX38_24350, partial [Streptomyces longwoodensis]